MNLSYALGDDADLRRRLMIRMGTPRTMLDPKPVAAAANNHTPETPDDDPLERITSEVYRVAQSGSTEKASSAEGGTGAF